MGGTSNYCNENAYRCEVTGYGRLQCTCTLNNIFTKNIIQIKIQIYDVKLTIFTWAKISESFTKKKSDLILILWQTLGLGCLNWNPGLDGGLYCFALAQSVPSSFTGLGPLWTTYSFPQSKISYCKQIRKRLDISPSKLDYVPCPIIICNYALKIFNRMQTGLDDPS